VDQLPSALDHAPCARGIGRRRRSFAPRGRRVLRGRSDPVLATIVQVAIRSNGTHRRRVLRATFFARVDLHRHPAKRAAAAKKGEVNETVARASRKCRPSADKSWSIRAGLPERKKISRETTSSAAIMPHSRASIWRQDGPNNQRARVTEHNGPVQCRLRPKVQGFWGRPGAYLDPAGLDVHQSKGRDRSKTSVCCERNNRPVILGPLAGCMTLSLAARKSLSPTPAGQDCDGRQVRRDIGGTRITG